MRGGPPGIAVNSARYVRRGRRLGSCKGGPGAADVYRASGRNGDGARLLSLDTPPGPSIGGPDGSRLDWAAGDNRCTPADEAYFRLVSAERWGGYRRGGGLEA